MLVFAYLDADTQAVRVSVHLDTTDEPLIRSDAMVPLHVEVGSSTVFSAGAVLERATVGGWLPWLRRLIRRMRWARGGLTPS